MAAWSRVPRTRLKNASQEKGRREAGLLVSNAKLASVFRDHRAAPTEAVVDAGLDGVLVVAEPGADDLRGTAGEGSAAEIVILVFHFGGPVRREHVFEARADRV